MSPFARPPLAPKRSCALPPILCAAPSRTDGCPGLAAWPGAKPTPTVVKPLLAIPDPTYTRPNAIAASSLASPV